MRITAVETIHLRRGITVHAGPIQWLWVRIHTDSGLTGLGETYPHPEAEKAVVDRSLAPVLLGRDPSQMRITAVETIHLRRGITVHAGPIQWLWVRIHTDSGLTGLGETYGCVPTA